MTVRVPIAAVALVAGLAATASAAPARRAIVVGNNQPASSDDERLRYADDDAIATWKLLEQAGVDAALLARPDAPTRRLHPGVSVTGPPTNRALAGAMEAAGADLAEAARAGRDTELLLVYSGHGDVDNGEGFVVLEDGRLTRRRLYRLLARSPAARNHVIVDACRSYFLAFDRGAGGRRRRYQRAFVAAEAPAAVRERTGFVLSTSSDRDSHEWERYQAGVFSHEVRSGLRGSADADRDGAITYAELGAFLSAANGDIPNPRFRPDFAVVPPGPLDTPVLTWPDNASALLLDEPGLGHVYAETERGVRVLDAHAAPGEVLAIRLPDASPVFVRTADGAREYALGPDTPARLSRLSPARPEIASRGALEVAFESLFARPFGRRDVVRFRRSYRRPPRRDAARADGWRPAVRTAAGWTAVTAAGLGLATTAWAAERYLGGRDASQRERVRRNEHIRALRTTSIVLSGVAAAAGSAWLWATVTGDDADGGAALSITPRAGGGAVVGVGGRW